MKKTFMIEFKKPQGISYFRFPFFQKQCWLYITPFNPLQKSVEKHHWKYLSLAI